MTPKQKANSQRAWDIRTLCGIYAQAYKHGDLTTAESKAILAACDSALQRIRGESETAKRKREREEAMSA